MAAVLQVDLRELRLLNKNFDDLVRKNPHMSRELHKRYGRDVKSRAQALLRMHKWGRSSQSEDAANRIYLRTLPKKTVVEALFSYASALETGTKPHYVPGNPAWDEEEGYMGRMHPGIGGGSGDKPASLHFASKSLNYADARFNQHVRDYFRNIDRVVMK